MKNYLERVFPTFTYSFFCNLLNTLHTTFILLQK